MVDPDADPAPASTAAGPEKEAATRAVDDVVRTAHSRLVAFLASTSGDIAAAEDALGDAVLAALATWPECGVPTRPDSWLLTAARRNLIDAARRRDVATRALPAVAQLIDERSAQWTVAVVPDTRLELLFVCAHPAIDPAMRSPLMLQTVLGLDAARIASAFLVAPTTMSQRLVRTKTKIKQAGVPFRLPGRDELPGRLDTVLEAVYGAHSTGWDDPSRQDPHTDGLTAEALRLARLVVELLPNEPEALGPSATTHVLNCQTRGDSDAIRLGQTRRTPRRVIAAPWTGPHFCSSWPSAGISGSPVVSVGRSGRVTSG